MSKKMTKITTSELILSAIFYLQQKNGVTAKEITKYICEKRGCAQKHMKENVKKALERATVKGIFCKNRGLYRINNGFGLNKVLNNKMKGKGKRTNRGAKAKENASDGKADYQIRFEGTESMPLNEMVDERMNADYDDRGFYVELPRTYDQDDDDDEDFEDTDDDDDDDENDFFSDEVDENEEKNEPKTLFFNENVNGSSLQGMDELKRSSDCNSFTGPLKKASGEQHPDNEQSEERLEERDEVKECEEEEIRDSEHDIPESESNQIRENSKEASENPSETVQVIDGNQSGDEDRDEEGYGDQHQEEMDWDCQLNDLECLDSLLEGDDYPMNMAQGKHVGSDTAWEKGMSMQKNSSRISLSIEDDPIDSFEASHMNESTR